MNVRERKILASIVFERDWEGGRGEFFKIYFFMRFSLRL